MDILLLAEPADDLVHLCPQDQLGSLPADIIKYDDVLPDPVQDLRPSEFKLEIILNGGPDFGLYLLIWHIHRHVGFTVPESVLDVDAQVAREDDDRLGKIDRVPLSVGHPAVFQDLQEFIQDRGMRFFDLVKEQDTERILLDGVGQLSARFVTYVSGRRAHQLLIGMALSVFAHVKTDAVALVPEQLLGQRLGCLRLTGSGRSGKEQHALWLPGRRGIDAVHAGHGALDDVQRSLQRGILPFDPLLKVLLGRFQALHIQAAPGIFLDAVLVQVDDGAQVADRDLFFFAEQAHLVQFSKRHAFRKADEPLLDAFQFIRMFRIVRQVPSVYGA